MTSTPHYLRDARSPSPSSAQASRTMAANRARDTKPELALRRALWAAGIRGYRISPRSVPGRPDITFIGRRVAIFVHGCFWHRCPHCDLPLPKSNRAFWRAKFARNQARDRKKEAELVEAGWTVRVYWECEVRDNLPRIVRDVARAVDRAK